MLVGEVEVDLEVRVELVVEGVKVRVGPPNFARPAVHFLSIEYNMHTHYICKRVNNQIQLMHTRKDKGRPHHHHGPEHQPSLDPYSARYRNGKV